MKMIQPDNPKHRNIRNSKQTAMSPQLQLLYYRQQSWCALRLLIARLKVLYWSGGNKDLRYAIVICTHKTMLIEIPRIMLKHPTCSPKTLKHNSISPGQLETNLSVQNNRRKIETNWHCLGRTHTARIKPTKPKQTQQLQELSTTTPPRLTGAGCPPHYSLSRLAWR